MLEYNSKRESEHAAKRFFRREVEAETESSAPPWRHVKSAGFLLIQCGSSWVEPWGLSYSGSDCSTHLHNEHEGSLQWGTLQVLSFLEESIIGRTMRIVLTLLLRYL